MSIPQKLPSLEDGWIHLQDAADDTGTIVPVDGPPRRDIVIEMESDLQSKKVRASALATLDTALRQSSPATFPLPPPSPALTEIPTSEVGENTSTPQLEAQTIKREEDSDCCALFRKCFACCIPAFPKMR